MKFDTETFITEIKKRQSLWNTNCTGYSDRNIKHREWEEVVNIYGAELSSEEKKKLSVNLQKKWRNIRDCFVKAHKAKEAKSGHAAKKKCSYIFYDNLLFLKDTVSFDSTTLNITSNVESNNADEVLEGQYIATRPSNSSKEPHHTEKNKNDDIGRELIGILNKKIESNILGEDEDRLFFMSLVKDFKKIPEHLRLQTKLDVLKVIRDAQALNYPKKRA